MNTQPLCAAGASACAGLLIALTLIPLSARADYRLEEREPIHHTFSNAGALDVDQINGAVTVIGDNDPTIRVEGEKIIRAEDPEAMARAKQDVVLDINEKNGTAQLYVNGPFRNNNHGYHEHDDRYSVTYNFTIRAPRATALRLHSINGKITTEDTAGKYDIHTINGAVTMTNIAGSGTAETLNGNTQVTFRENPEADSLFKTFNGRVNVSFLPNLSANLHVKTFNGAAYTDFDATALPSDAPQARLNRSSNLRVGAGGPELRFETFNGTIEIHKLAR